MTNKKKNKVVTATLKFLNTTAHNYLILSQEVLKVIRDWQVMVVRDDAQIL